MVASCTKKMIFFNLKVEFALIGFALIVALESQPSFARFLPDHLHCATEVYYQNETANGFNWYEVDEYVDWPNGRSSIKLANIDTEKNSIFYNQLSPLGGSSNRKFMVYNLDKNICKSSSINEWPLNRIRKIVISMLQMEKLNREVCDVALGPSALLLAIEESSEDFRFVRRDFSKTRLTKIDIYERRIDNEVDLKANDASLIITVRVVGQKMPLVKMADTTLADQAFPEFLSLTICQVPNAKLKLQIRTDEYSCNNRELLIEVDYFILSERMAGSLIGQSLSESGNFDFHRDPFMRPIGIGCWKDYDFANQRKFSVPSLQFSGEYITSNGTSGSSYIAYDGYRRLMRLDRDDRKSIYDLDRGQSYHTNAFNPVRELSESAANFSRSCIVMDMSDDGLMSPSSMERLIGVGPTKKTATHYMGTKMIDHVAYDVFEVELAYADLVEFGVPIVVQSTGYVVFGNKEESSTSGKATRRFFMTYYVHDDQDTMGTVGTFRDDDSRTTFSSSMAPKFVELWEVTLPSQRRNLVNRLEFTQFSWSLEIQPNGDPDTQDLSHLFYMKSCAQARSTQWQVRFRVSQDTDKDKSQLTKTEVAAFRTNRQLIGEALQDELANTLDISRLQVAQMDIKFLQKSADLLVDTRLVELQTGISDDQTLGNGQFLETMTKLKDYITSFRYNRHSLEACRLDSVSRPEISSYMFCRALTVCVVFQRDALTKLHLQPGAVNDMARNPSGRLSSNCEIHQYDWAPNSVARQDSLSAKINGNIYELIKHPFSVKFRYTEQGQLTKFARFTGLSHAIKLKKFDSVGLEDSRASLVGLRYTTVQEEPKARNLNIPVKLAPKREDRFTYCQMACQLDEYCESFSVCVRKQAAPIQGTDCVLAALKLTSDRVERISQMIKNSVARDEGLELRESDKFKSQVFRFRRDSDCNIHPKDIISSYKMVDTIEIANSTTTTITTKGEPKNSTIASDEQEFGRVRSLEECAEESFDYGRQMNFIDSNFTYCPLNSICMPNKRVDQTQLTSASAAGQLCNFYKRSHTQFYNARANTRLSIVVKGNTRLGLADLKDLKVGRPIEGLALEECARDCNLRQSNCLAFDSCKTKGGMKLCVLYSIRSPMSRLGNKKLGLLPQEEQFYGSSNGGGMASNGTGSSEGSFAMLTGNVICNHFALRRIYFDIRLQQLLDGAKLNADLPQRGELNEMEDSIIDGDQKRGEAESRANSADQASGSQRSDTTSSGSFQTLLFFFGLILGSIGFINAGKAQVWALDSWERIRNQYRLRRQGHRLSQLALANNPDV